MASKPSDPGLAAHLADYPDPGVNDLPPGYTLDPQESSSGLPPGYTLDPPSTRQSTGQTVLNQYRHSGQPIANVLRGLIQPFQEAGAFGAEAIRRGLGGQVRPEDRLPSPTMPPTVASETLQNPNMFLDPTNFLTGAGLGATTAARAGLPLAGVAKEAVRQGLGFQTFGLSDLIPGLAGFGRGVVKGYREGPTPPPPPPPPPSDAELEAMAWAAKTPQERRGFLDMAPPEGTYQPSQPMTGAQRIILRKRLEKEAAALNAQRAAEQETQRLNIERGGLLPTGSTVYPQAPMPPTEAGRLLTPAEIKAAAETQLPVPPGVQKSMPQATDTGYPIAKEIPSVGPAELPPSELPLNPSGTVELGMGLPIPKSVKDWAKRSFPVQAGMQALKASLPADLRVLSEAPQSPVISLVDRVTNDVGSGIKNLTAQPWAKALTKYTPAQLKDLEAQAVTLWQQGGKTSASYAQAVRAMPPEIQAMMQERSARIPIEQQARKILGLPETDTVAGPYFPRIAPRDLNEIVTVGRQGGIGLGNDLRTTIGGFAKSRVHDTMLNGEAAGTTYADPRSAWALREWYSQTLEATAKMVKDMEGTVLFRSKADALARNPSGTPTRVEGIPGSETWWTPTKAEADFLQQNLTKQSYGPSAGLSSLSNQMFRNPNLFNPYPHFIKNMLFKFGLSGGNFAKVRGSMNELATQPTNPLVQRFKTAFPVEETSALPNELLRTYLRPEPNILEQGLNAAQRLNRYSRERIFTEMDPGLRYARWKQYVAKGMSDTEAANNVHLDLVRYGLRSSAKDFWQSIPLNFFTAWRTGTVMSLYKQATSHPIKAALFVGAVEYLREARYRQTGQWTHIPTDYIEAPLAQIVEHPTPSTILPIVATTALFGPGGAVTASTLRDALDDVRGGGDWKRVQNMFWGLSQLYNIPKEWEAFRKTNNVSHLGNILTSAAIAEHSALNYEPRRFTKYLPESLPFMRKSQLVNDAEYLQAVKKARSEQQQMRREARPRRTIEERLTNE
jgi:hypothetical protein